MEVEMGITKQAEGSGQGRVALLVGVALTVLLYFLPYYVEYRWYRGWPLMLFSTFAHEMGHGVAALLSGGHFESFQMWANGSGVARTSSSGALASAFVSAGGLVGPAVLAACLFVLGRKARTARAALYGLGLTFLLTDLLVVSWQNPFGLIFVGAMGLACLLIAKKTSAEVSRTALVFLAVQLALSVYSRGDYLFTDVAETSAGTLPSDVAQIANALFPPYWFWGLACGAFSVLVLLVGLFLFWRSDAPTAGSRQPTAF
jgi:hypothetical protein